METNETDLAFYSFLLPVLSTILIGGAMTFVYKLIALIEDRLTSNFTASISIKSTDPMHEWLLIYLQEKVNHKTSNLTVKTERKLQTNSYVITSVENDAEKPDLTFQPNMGFHSFIYSGKKISVFQSNDKTITTGEEKAPTKLGTIMLSCYGPENITLLKKLCSEAMEFALDKDKNLTHVYALRPYGASWEKVQSKKPRSLSTVILDSNIAEEVISDIKNFTQSQQWYLARGVPYRRGYMLHGPPGTGKTSFILAVAAELKLSVCLMNLTGNIDDNQLMGAMENAPKNTILLLEDVDSIFIERTSVNESKGRKISFSGLLNAIDGVRTQEGRILFMSTNHIEKLDPALLRPGRSDVHVKLDYASKEQIRRMWMRFYPEEKEGMVEGFLKVVPEKKVSMAKLQGHFLRLI